VKGTPPVARAAEPCSSFRLEEGDLDLEALLGAVKDQEQIVAGVRAPLATEPHGAPAATLLFGDEGDRVVDVLERIPGRTRIAWHADHAVVTGWIPSKSLERVTSAFGGIGAVGVDPAARPSPEHAITCTHDVPVAVELGAEKRTVGTIEAGTPLAPLGDGDEGFVVVDVTAPGVVLADQARLVTLASELADCR
jgi:hypothetical protein